MIESLRGLQETVHFKNNTNLRLYKNDDFEAYPKHWHAPLEIIMSLKNPYVVTCYNSRIVLKEGDIILITPGALHGMEASVGKRFIMQADFTLLHGIKSLESLLSIISPMLLITPSSAPKTHPLVHALIHEIFDEYFNDSPLGEAFIYAKLLEIFVHIGRNHVPCMKTYDKNSRKHREYTERFMFICDYIQEHSDENLTLEQVAALSGFSKYHFSRLFKQFTNVTFYRYLNRKRIEKAEKLLVNQESTITDIALSCGFSSLSSFIRMFKLIKDCTPTEFKNMYTS